MMSLRALARSTPRAFSRASTTAIRRSTATRTSSLLKSQPAWLRPQQASAFSTTTFRRSTAGETDDELSAKLKTEIDFEKDLKENEPVPSSIKDFLENSPFEILDVEGKEEVKLTRTFGNEKITVTFSIADLQSYDPDFYEEDPALADEEGEAADEEGLGEGAGDAAVPCRLSIVIEKPGQGALNIEAQARDGNITVENLYYYKDAQLVQNTNAENTNAENSHAAAELYLGPPFGSLDQDLQILMERYLEERGITQALAVFVPDYMDMKEQKEYLSWLTNVKTFVDA